MNKTGTRKIETHRLILRPFTVEDAEEMYANWASDPEVTRFLTWPAHPDVSLTRKLLESWTSRYSDGAYFQWAIGLKESGAVIGSIGVIKLEEAIGSAEIGYCLGRAFWGRGIMPEALRAVMDYLFGTVGLNRVWAGHDVNNPKSGRVMEKAGMKKEGVLRASGINNQGIRDMAVWAALREDRAPKPERQAVRITARFAREDELDRINELRRQVNDLHVIVVADLDGTVCGFAVLNHIMRPENPFMYERDFLDIDEFGVDEAFRRQGAASEMVRFIRNWAKEKGYRRLELNMWEFNLGALAFYEASDFRTYRRYMEIYL